MHNPVDCSPADSSVRGILQTRMLPFSSSGDLPNPGLEPESPALQADSLPTELSGKPILYFIAPFISVLEPLFASVTVQTEVNGKDSKYRSSPGRLWGGGVLGAALPCGKTYGSTCEGLRVLGEGRVCRREDKGFLCHPPIPATS